MNRHAVRRDGDSGCRRVGHPGDSCTQRLEESGGLGAMAWAIVLGRARIQRASRTWVSGVGDDANPCSRTAPCKTFAAATSRTAPSGEISVLDPGGFGAVT